MEHCWTQAHGDLHNWVFIVIFIITIIYTRYHFSYNSLQVIFECFIESSNDLLWFY